MGFEIALIVVQTVIALMFLPLRIRIDGHVSLARMSLQLDVRAFALRVAALRLRCKNGRFKFTVNGKKPKKTRISFAKIASLPTDIKRAYVDVRGRMAARVGADDARVAALVAGHLLAIVAPIVSKRAAYTSHSETFEMDIGVKIKINLLQLAQIAL